MHFRVMACHDSSSEDLALATIGPSTPAADDVAERLLWANALATNL